MVVSSKQHRNEVGSPPASALLNYILQMIASTIPVDAAQVYTYGEDLRRAELVGRLPPESDDLHWMVEARLGVSTDEQFITPPDLVHNHFRSATLIPLKSEDEVIGALVLCSYKAQSFLSVDTPEIENCVGITRALLENNRLKEDQVAARAIQEAAHILDESPSMQDMVNLLRDHVFGAHITTCVALLYGPQQEDRPNGPFDYLEVRGSWSKRLGAGIGQGMRFYLDLYRNVIDTLDEHRILHFSDLKIVEPLMDPLVRGFLRGQRAQSMALIALGTTTRRLGALVILTDKRHEFTPRELRSYRTVSEFLSMSAMAQVLQQQHDFVQQGRAALLDAVTDGVLMILPDEGVPGRNSAKAHVLTVNQSFTRLFNLSQERAQGLSLAQLLERLQIPEDVRQRLGQQWLSIPVRDPSRQQGEFNIMHPQNYPASIVWDSAPVYQGSRVLGRIYTFHDVSADRAAANLRASFISRMSHELRTPLTSIKGFAQLAAEETDLTPTAREYITIIFDNARHLNNLFSDIIEITRADTGELRLNITRVWLPRLIADVAAQFKPRTAEQDQAIVLELDEALPPVPIDASRITRVLQQLLDNALKHAPLHSSIHIGAQQVRSTDQFPRGAPADVTIPAVLVSVIDEGPGLSTTEAKEIFTAFFRTRAARSAKMPGSGLGLTIARSLVELHRGKIWAAPTPRGQRGARFYFTLPTDEEAGM
jgi:signal transduction histidine kinase